MVGYVIGLVIGAIFVLDAGWEMIKRWHRRRHYVRVPGVFVGRRDARGEQAQSPNVQKRAATFRFTTVEGRVIETESSVQSFPGPKPGTRMTVIYDPERPYRAEPAGRFTITILVLPVVMVAGLIVVIMSLRGLL